MARFEMMWRNKWLTADADSIDDMINDLQAAADELRQMRDAGVVLADTSGTVADDYALLVTEDPAVAEKFGFQEDEFEDEDASEDEVKGASEEGEEGGEKDQDG